MACNSCNSCNGIVFPDFVANSCCNPCCENSNAADLNNNACGYHTCGNTCGCGNSCGCNTCGCTTCDRYPWLPGCNTR